MTTPCLWLLQITPPRGLEKGDLSHTLDVVQGSVVRQNMLS